MIKEQIRFHLSPEMRFIQESSNIDDVYLFVLKLSEVALPTIYLTSHTHSGRLIQKLHLT